MAFRALWYRFAKPSCAFAKICRAFVFAPIVCGCDDAIRKSDAEVNVVDGLIPTKPYMVRAMHEWCVDNGLTPHLLVAVNAQCRVPMAYVKDGEVVLNLNYTATKDLLMDNDAIVFSARFGGVSQHLYVPMNAVKGIFARENGQGMFFELDPEAVAKSKEEKPALVVAKPDANTDAVLQQGTLKPSTKKKPTLTIVK